MTDDPDDDPRHGSAKGPEAFRTISEVAEELGLPQHVLRFWETRFPQIKPIKRGGGRRYYRPNDVDLLRGIKQLLYGEGYTIRGVQKILREQGGRKVASFAAGTRAPAPAAEDAETAGEVAAGPAASHHGPEIWAPPSRRAPQSSVESDPPAAISSYGPAERSAAERVSAAAPPAAPALSDDQIRRLSSALSELKACRRLIDERL